MWLAVLLGGCELVELVSDTPSTLVRDVRVVAMVMEPPELRPGGSFFVQPTILNPLGRPLDVMVWTCVEDNGTCLGWSDGLGPSVQLGWGPGRALVLQAPRLPDELLLFGEPIPIPVYALACQTGACPIIDQVASQTRSLQGLQRELADPDLLLSELPEDGVWLASHTVRQSLNVLDPNENPRIMPESAYEGGCDIPLSSLDPREQVQICLVTGDSDGGPLVAYAFTTAGRLLSARERVRGRRVEFTYQAPTANEISLSPNGLTLDVVIVAEEDDGSGSAVFSQTFTVE